MPAQSLDEIIAREAPKFADQIRTAAAMAANEEEIRVAAERQLAFVEQLAGITLEGRQEVTVASGRVDSAIPASSSNTRTRIRAPALVRGPIRRERKRSSSRSRSSSAIWRRIWAIPAAACSASADGNHPHVAYNFLIAVSGEQPTFPDGPTNANWTMVGICALESAMKGGERVKIPGF